MLEDRVIGLELEYPELLGDPAAAGFREDVSEVRMAFEDACPEQGRERALGPHVHFADEHRRRTRDIAVVRRPARVGLERHLELFEHGPERLVARVVIEGMRARAGRQQHAPPEPHLPRGAHFLDRRVDVVDVDHRHARMARRIRIAEIGEPAVVGATAREILLRRHRIAVLHQACAEGRHLRKDDLARDPVVVELLHTHRRIELAPPRCKRTLLVAEHLHDLVVREPHARIGHRLHALPALARLLGVGLDRFLIEEGPGPGHHLARVGEPPGIRRIPILTREVLVVGRGQGTRVTIRTDDHDLLRGDLRGVLCGDGPGRGNRHDWLAPGERPAPARLRRGIGLWTADDRAVRSRMAIKI